MSEETKATAPAEDKPWYEEGFDSDIAQETPNYGDRVNRFWMPNGTDKSIIFLTSQPFMFREHNPQINGSFKGNWFTCPQTEKGDVECDICKWSKVNKNAFGRYAAGAFTIIDATEWTDKKGNKHVNEKKLLVAKSGTLEILKRKHANRVNGGGKGLRGCMFTVYRSKKDKSPGCGDDFEFVKEIDLSTMKDSTEFDYKKILAPSMDDLRKVIVKLSGGGGGPAEEVKY